MTGLRVPALDPDVDVLAAAFAYAAAGWYVAPTSARDPKNPGSVLGGRWQTLTSRDPEQLAAWFAGTDYRLALHAGRSGAVVFDVDHPAALPTVLAAALPAAPFQESRPDQAGRGHAVFACPPGRRIGNSVGQLGRGWGEVRGLNGVIAAAPSVHADHAAGAAYRWARTGAVPVLPNQLAELLPDAGETIDAATDAQVAAFLAEHTAAACPGRLRGPVARFEQLVADGGSRHDSLVEVACWAAREVLAGQYTAREAFDTLAAGFVAAATSGAGARTPQQAQREAAGVIAWAVAQASREGVTAARERVAVSRDPERQLVDPTYLTERAAASAATAGEHVNAGSANTQVSSVPLFPGTVVGERGTPASAEPDVEPARPLFVDVAALLDGGMPDPPAPALLHRDDGHAIFYAGQVNLIFGEPESGKTLVVLAAAAEALQAGRRVAVIDLDHNGPEATIYRLLDMGAPEEALRHPSAFRYVEPEDAQHLREVVADLAAWRPAVAVVDSIGELLPIMRLSSNSPDDFTTAHSGVLKPLAAAGAAVLAVDHLPKDTFTASKGPTGTAAKRRAIGGVAIRVEVDDPFTPGRGGSAYLTVNKDRHGGLRRTCPVTTKREPVAGLFRIEPGDGAIQWTVKAAGGGDAPPRDRVDPADLAALDQLDPPPSSVRDVKQRMRWQSERAAAALRVWKHRPTDPADLTEAVPGEQGTLDGDAGNTSSTTAETRSSQSVPLFRPSVPGNGEHSATPPASPCRDCGQPLLLAAPGRDLCERCRLNERESA